ncbi:MAG: PAS domain S-box protein [Magnetococcales bacterium]|nr:PAS domain S-box protein [Magnetococcales bacterium]
MKPITAWLKGGVDRLFPGGPIARRLTFAVILFSSLITVATTTFQLYHNFQEELASIHQFFNKDIQDGHLESIAQSVWVVDEQQIRLQLKGLSRMPHVEYLAIHLKGKRRWKNGRIIAHYQIKRDFPLHAHYRGSRLEIGVLEVVVGMDGVYWRLLDQALMILISNALKTFLVAGFILFLFQYLVTRHLTYLAAFVQEMTPHRPFTPCHLDRPAMHRGDGDEIERVVNAINKMGSNLSGSFKSLTEAEERFRMLSNSVRDVFWISSRTWEQIYYVSIAYEQIWGRSRQNLIENPLSWLDSVVVEDRERVSAQVAWLSQRSFVEYAFPEYRIMRPDGETRWILSRVYPVMDEQGEIFRVVGVAEDVTERHHAELARRDSEKRYRTLFKTSGEGIFFVDSQGHIEEANDAFLKMVGHTMEVLKEMPHRALFPDPWWDQVACQASGDEQRDGVVLEQRCLRHDGEMAQVLIRGWWVRDAEGRPVRWMALARDITEQKRMMRELEQTRRMKAIGALAGGIAHDFNNILGIIMGHGELATLSLDDQVQLQTSLEEIMTASGRGRDLVRQLLTFSRQGGKGVREPLQPQQVVAETIRLIRATLPATIEIHPELTVPDVVLMGDASQIQQMVMNLCVNAGHAMPDGGVLELQLTACWISSSEAVSLRIEPGHYVRLVVTDHGEGIEEAHLGRIFEPFFTTREKGKGSGLGLAVTHGIVRGCGGSIQVESRLGYGTSFTIHLPIADQPSPLTQVPDTIVTPVKTRVESGEILLVDDDPTLLKVGCKMLGSLGYSVVSFERAKPALEALKLEPSRYRLLITDQTMPEMTGLALGQVARQVAPELPMMICTGFSESVTANNAHEKGFDGFLQKPFIREELAAALREVLRDEA